MDKKEFERIFGLISKAGRPTIEDKKDLLDLLANSSALQRVLCGILLDSDEKLANVGKGDLTTDQSVKALARLQGEAFGLSNAVEFIVELATSKENENV